MVAAESSEDVPRSIGRVLDLLEAVLAAPGCNLTTAASTSGLTPTTALRHLRALEARGYVSRDVNGLFSAGPTLLRLAAGLKSSGLVERLIVVAQPYLDELANATGESTYLAVSDGRSASYVAAAEGTHAIRHVGWVGQQVPLAATAVGAAIGNPGVVQSRTGAVESDITAMSIAFGTDEVFGAAISVLGPEHRMRGAASDIAERLEHACGKLVSSLGLDQELAS